MKNIDCLKTLVKRSMYCSVSIITKEGFPHSSPIGSVFIEDKYSGYFIELFSKSINDNSSKYASILAVNTSVKYWIKSLYQGKFSSHPAIRILVELEEARDISEKEKNRFLRRVKILKYLKGYELLWSQARFVRPFSIKKTIPVKLGAMTKHL